MKLLLGSVLLVVLSGCIPIGMQGRTSAVVPGSAPYPATYAVAISA